MDLNPVTLIRSTPAIYLICAAPVLIFIYLQQAHSSSLPKGCRRLGLPPGQTNLHDEYDPKYNHGSPSNHVDESGLPSWRVKALFSYPIKSCAGVEFDVADVVSTGLAYDRQFCFAEYVTPKHDNNKAENENENDDDPKKKPHWDFRTMRDGRFSKMALIRPEIYIPDPTAPDYSPQLDEVKSQGVMVIHYPRVLPSSGFLVKLGIKLGFLSRELSFRVPLSPPQDRLHSYPSRPVRIWKDFPLAYDYAQHVPTSLVDFLASDTSNDDQDRRRRPLTLFRLHPAHPREIFRCAPRKTTLGFQPVTGFADAYPLNLQNLASVRDVAARCRDEIPELSVRRFRANVIVQGPQAFAEDHWKRIRLGGVDHDRGVELHTVCRTMRCRLPNVDPDSGVRHPSEPDRTLKSYRRVDPGDPTNACLGMQIVPAVKEFSIRVNDPITVLETGEHFYIKMLAPGERVPGV